MEGTLEEPGIKDSSRSSPDRHLKGERKKALLRGYTLVSPGFLLVDHRQVLSNLNLLDYRSFLKLEFSMLLCNISVRETGSS